MDNQPIIDPSLTEWQKTLRLGEWEGEPRLQAFAIVDASVKGVRVNYGYGGVVRWPEYPLPENMDDVEWHQIQVEGWGWGLTINEAEMLSALQSVIHCPPYSEITIFSDSAWVVKWLNGKGVMNERIREMVQAIHFQTEQMYQLFHAHWMPRNSAAALELASSAKGAANPSIKSPLWPVPTGAGPLFSARERV
jgi:ribonuclease HI